MQDRVLNATDVLIDWEPFICDLAVRRRCFDPRIGKSREIPGRIDERVHRIRFAASGAGAFRTFDVLPGRMAVKRVSRLVETHVVRKGHGKIFFGNRYGAATLAMNNRSREPPGTLAADTA